MPRIGESFSADPVPKPLVPVSVRVAGLDAPVAWYGAAPNMVAGVLQVNCTIPAGAPSGPQPLVLALGTATSRQSVTVYVQ